MISSFGKATLRKEKFYAKKNTISLSSPLKSDTGKVVFELQKSQVS